MTKQIDPKSLNIAHELIDSIQLHEKLNIESLIFRQIERTHNSSLQGELVFAANVKLLMNMVPSYKKSELEERSEEYLSTQKSYRYKYNCGVPLGTPEKPVQGSPAIVEEEVVDWYKLLEIILEIFEDCGLTWKRDSLTVETGKIELLEKNIMPTPTFAKDVQQLPENNIVHEIVPKVRKQRIQRCAVCGERILPGTGKRIKNQEGENKLVHKDVCYEAMKSSWNKPNSVEEPSAEEEEYEMEEEN